MATAEYWAEAVIVREQRTLFAPTLDEMIDTVTTIRFFEATLINRNTGGIPAPVITSASRA